MLWTIKFTASAQRQLKRLDRAIALRVLDYLDDRVAPLNNPRVLAKKLTGPTRGVYWRYRVGAVRVICDFQDEQLLILVIEIGHRREVYRNP